MRSLGIALTMALTLSLIGCAGDEGSLTGPGSFFFANLSGTWTGDLGRRGIADWTDSTITLQQQGRDLTGTLTNGEGRSWGLDGEVRESNDGALLSVLGLPGTSTCSGLGMSVQRFERDERGRVVELHGLLNGRCFGTVAHDFVLERQSF